MPGSLMHSHRLLVAAVGAAALACTSPNDGQPPALAAKGAVAVAAPAETCDFAGTPVPVTALGMVFSPSADATSLAANLCTQRPNETTVGLVLWATGAGAPATFAPGTYTVQQDATGGLSVFQVRLDAGCAVVPPNVPALTGSTLTLGSVTAGRITGSINLAFADGRALAGAFDAPVVPAAVTACQMFGVQGGAPAVGCTARTCSP
jgi:hypothetical protein